MAFSILLTAALAASLTVQPGETGCSASPMAARSRRSASTPPPPRPGQIKLTAKRMMGTMLTLTNNSGIAYTYRATLIGGDGKAIVARSCILPPATGWRWKAGRRSRSGCGSATSSRPPTRTAADPMAKLYFYYAAMNAGKSTTLLQADFNYRERGMETMLWTAAFDDRSGRG